ncbi:glycosyltransferase [Neorhizobium sp. JUb45]|uniref:glycosyltransferase family 8 protein n=1 Tax=unclassified Neorhizobium TaxID=2629175 RepID=UPI0010DC84CA|nr:glycosyltransferase [Neorhizobium sp. JUb45]TCQ99963.1 lipopolysaccharide biosynthesis glycosyltransferase [Neorhizobium sp. JUb45]
MNSQCIAYVSDENYFFPTAVSALQARAHAKPSTDVVIVLADAFKNAENARKFCADHRIRLIDASALLSEHFKRLNAGSFSHRITVSAMGRLLLSEVLASDYDQVIYIDGDTQINGSLDYLEELTIEPGKLAAALDYLSLVERFNGTEQTVIFNSGVLKFNPKDWIGHAAFDHFVAHGGHLHDQGALNAVVGDALVLISNKWNFPKQFLHLIDGYRPTIVHFMAHPKPWDGRFFPWTNAETQVYRAALHANPCLKPFASRISALRYWTYRFRSLRDEFRFRFGFDGLPWNRKNIQKVLSS